MINGEFTGPVKEGVRDGIGRLEWSNGDYYEGDFKNGLRHGKGIMVEQNGARKYEGTWVLSQKEGKGKEIFANGDRYIGEYSRDRFNGEGELVTRGGTYTGSFKDGLRDGFGTMQFRTNCRYEGFWVKGRMNGKGLYIWPDTRKYEGQWENGERTGMGILTQVNGEKYGEFHKSYEDNSHEGMYYVKLHALNAYIETSRFFSESIVFLFLYFFSFIHLFR